MRAGGGPHGAIRRTRQGRADDPGPGVSSKGWQVYRGLPGGGRALLWGLPFRTGRASAGRDGDPAGRSRSARRRETGAIPSIAFLPGQSPKRSRWTPAANPVRARLRCRFGPTAGCGRSWPAIRRLAGASRCCQRVHRRSRWKSAHSSPYGHSTDPGSFIDERPACGVFISRQSIPCGSRRQSSPSIAANLTVRLVQVHFAIVLVVSGLHKLQFGDWWSGVAWWYPLNPPFEPRPHTQICARWRTGLMGALGLPANRGQHVLRRISGLVWSSRPTLNGAV